MDYNNYNKVHNTNDWDAMDAAWNASVVPPREAYSVTLTYNDILPTRESQRVGILIVGAPVNYDKYMARYESISISLQ